MIRALIVDDEPIAREGIRALLLDEPDVEVVGECGNGIEAVQAIRHERPDLMFLDVQMPDLDGFGVLARLDPAEIPAVVFVTAYDEYALRAFEVNAVDYLLKPFDRERFARSLERAVRAVRHDRVGSVSEKMLALLRHVTSDSVERGHFREDRLLIKDRGRVTFVRRDEIDWIEVRGNYLRLYAGRRRYLVRDTLTAMGDKLDPGRFLRISRSHLINAERVVELRRLPSGRYRFLMGDGAELQSSRRYAMQVERFFELD